MYNLFQLAGMAVRVLVEVEYLMEYDYCCCYCGKFHHLLNQSLIHCARSSNYRGFDAEAHVRVVYLIISSCLNYAYDNSGEIWKESKKMEWKLLYFLFVGFFFCGDQVWIFLGVFDGAEHFSVTFPSLRVLINLQ